jgi:hypothetical protein
MLPAVLSADEQTVNYVSPVVESFDPGEVTTEWIVQGSKFVDEENGYPKWSLVDGWPEALHGRNWEEKDLQVMAITTAFTRQGYNYIEIIPVTEGEDGEVVHNPLKLEGRVKTIDMWVLGTQFDYYIEVHVKDCTGVIHVLRMGDLSYKGWKNLKADIPTSIPQYTNFKGEITTGLELVKFMIWTTPHEDVSEYYVFIDQIKILTDDFVTRFDGDDLLRPEIINDINWSSSEGTEE